MRKFLKLVEESKPSNNSQYVISINGPAKLEDINVSGDEFTFDLHQKIKAIVEGRADVEVHDSFSKGEDNEMIDKEFKKKAKTDPKFLKAIQDRERALDKKLMDFEKITQELEKQ